MVRKGIATLVLGLAAAPVLAEPAHGDLEQITVTATRSEKDVSEVPATVTVISSETIENQLARDIKDLVRFEPGVAVRTSPPRFTAAGSSTGRDGNSGFNIRGLEGNRVLIQVDGVRVPDAYSFGAQAMGRGDYVDLDILKSVEIVRGPSSALYGSDGLAGSISFFTKDPGDLLQNGRPFAFSGRAAYGSADNTYSESLLAAGQSGAWEALLAYTRRDGEEQETRGDNESLNVDRTVANPEDNVSNAALGKVVYTLNDTNRLRLTWDHLDRDVEWNVFSAVAKPPLISTSALSLAAFDEMQRDRFTLDHRYENGSEFIRTARTAIYHQQSETRQFAQEDRNTAPDRTRDSTFDNTVQGAMLELTSEFNLGGREQRLVYGADYSVTKQEGVRDGTVPPVGETFPTRAFPVTDYTLAGVFVQDEITLGGGRVSLYPALRWDYYEIKPQNDPLFTASTPASQSDSHVSPKLSALVRITDRVNAFANVAAGFRAPSPSQVNNGFSNPVAFYQSISNPNLEPETSETFEVGLRLRNERWSGSVAVFTGQYDDFIEQVQVGGNSTPTNPTLYQYINLADVRISGAEAKAQVIAGRGFSVIAAASYARGDSDANGVEAPLASIEPFKVVTGLDWKAANGKFGSRLYATYSDAKDAARTGVTCQPSCFLPDSFMVVDVTGWWKITDQTSLRAGVFNVGNEKYWWWSDVRGVSSTSTVTDAYSQPGRNVSVSLSMRF